MSTTYPNDLGIELSGYAVGWGKMSSGGNASDLILNVKLNIFNTEVCNMYSSVDWSKQLCAGDLNGGKDTCQGY